MARFDNMQAAALDGCHAARERPGYMTRNPLLITVAAAAALAGCEPETIVAGPPGVDQTETNAAANANVELPPSIAASKIYRCKDGSVVYIDWLSDQKSANVRTDKNGSPTQVVAPQPGQPMTAEGGYSVTGTATAASATVAVPGRGSQSCKA